MFSRKMYPNFAGNDEKKIDHCNKEAFSAGFKGVAV